MRTIAHGYPSKTQVIHVPSDGHSLFNAARVSRVLGEQKGDLPAARRYAGMQARKYWLENDGDLSGRTLYRFRAYARHQRPQRQGHS
eukprot:10678194-Lingulodinium_polyedra.AAC.1